jgi:hypothetical protein
MALFARTRNHAREVELEQRVNALQVALNQCKGVARQWWGLRARFTVGVAVVALAIGFTLGVYRHAIKEAIVETAAAVGIAGPQRDAAEEAEALFQKGDYAKALKLARPLADAGDPRAEAIIGLAYYRGRGAPHDDAEAAKWRSTIWGSPTRAARVCNRTSSPRICGSTSPPRASRRPTRATAPPR